MNFNEITVLLEEGASDIATTFDVYKKGNSTMVKFNNKEMPLEDFGKEVKNKNPEALEILLKLKEHPKFKEAGNLYTFLTQYLKDDDHRLDLVIKKNLIQYDNDEIKRNSKDYKPKNYNSNTELRNKYVFKKPIVQVRANPGFTSKKVVHY